MLDDSTPHGGLLARSFRSVFRSLPQQSALEGRDLTSRVPSNSTKLMPRILTVLGIILALSAFGTSSAEATGAHGVVVPNGSKPVGKSRFRSSKDWDRTLRFFRSVFRREKGVVFQTLKSPPAIKAVYIENTNPKKNWEGINVYQTKNQVFIYVIANRDAKKSRSKSSKRK